MEPNTVIAAAGPSGLILIGVAVVVLIVVVAVAVIVRRRGTRPATQGQGMAASGPTTETPVALQNRLRQLTADLDMTADSALETPLAAPTRPSPLVRPAAPVAVPAAVVAPAATPVPAIPASPLAPTPAPLRTPDDATRLFGAADEDGGEEEYAAPLSHDATHFFGGLDEGALLSPSQTRYFSPDDLALDDPLDGAGLLQALPPKRDHGDDAFDAIAPALANVQEYLRTVTAPEVLALSVIDSTGQVLAGAADEEVADELRALLTESGRGVQADVEQELRFDDDSHGAVFLVPTGADALLGALVRDDDLQETRTYLRRVATHVGETLRAAS